MDSGSFTMIPSSCESIASFSASMHSCLRLNISSTFVTPLTLKFYVKSINGQFRKRQSGITLSMRQVFKYYLWSYRPWLQLVEVIYCNVDTSNTLHGLTCCKLNKIKAKINHHWRQQLMSIKYAFTFQIQINGPFTVYCECKMLQKLIVKQTLE